MKKYLYGTTILAAVGLAAGPVSAAEPLHMELSGYYTQWFGQADDGLAGVAEGVSLQNAEVNFNMRGELDNGLKIGGRIELEGTSNGGDRIDQHYLILAGGFGELRIGAINSGRYSYGWNTSDPSVGMGINSGWASSWMTTGGNTISTRFRSPAISTVIDASNDEQKLTYFTPRFNGFQLTGSWTPQGHIITSGSVGQGGANPYRSADATTYTNGWDLGVSYSGAFDQVGVEVQAGVAGADEPDFAVAAVDALFDDYLAYNGGIAFSYAGFSIAGSFAVVDEGLAFATGANSNEGRSFNTGIAYSTGPWGFSAAYFNGREEGVIANAPDEENEFFALGASYALGPGLRTTITFLSGEYEDDLVGAANVAAGDNDARAVVVGIHAGF